MLNKTLLVLILLFSSSVGSEFKKGEKIYSIMCD